MIPFLVLKGVKSMRDLLKELIIAKSKTIYNNDDFKKLLYQLKALNNNNTINWDEDAGEEWAFVCNQDLSIMLNCRIGICFIRGEMSGLYLEALSYCNCVSVKGYDVREWYVDIDDLKKYIPEIDWTVSKDGVDPSNFSLDELYFETV